MKLDALPRISGAGFHALFDGEDLVAVAAYVVDDTELQAALPEARETIKRASHGVPGQSRAFVITDPPRLPEGVDPRALTVALTFVRGK